MALYKVLLVLAAALCLAAAYPGGLGLGLGGGLGGGLEGGQGGGHGKLAESYASVNLLNSLGHGSLESGSLGGSLGGHEEEHIILAHPKYEYKYGVEDSHTGDYKDAKEERDGDIVKGEYSLLQPDGRKRIVHYTSSKHGGFNAIVSYSGHAIHPETHSLGGHY